MTAEKLLRIRSLIEDIEGIDERIARARAQACGTVTSISPEPRGGITVPDKIGQIICIIEAYEATREAIRDELLPLLEWVYTIPDDQDREIFRMRYIHGKTFRDIASVTGKSKSSVQRTVIRYID